MLKDRLQNMPIMSLQTGAKIAKTGNFIIDPRQLKIVAFYCSGSRLDINPAVLTVSDIREISEIGLIVDSADVLVSPDDLVRLSDVLSFGFTLEDKQVIDESGRKLGKVDNYSLDPTTLYVIKLHVQPSFWQAWGTTEFTIDRTQIIEVTDTEIVVKDTRKKVTQKVRVAPTPMLDNPFKPKQAESTSFREPEK